ncbi:hypothetical protein ACGFYQ_33900 [Streptomyces sp. NPDC048258]|uniref:hypothetical protein n=1 Tax=Streptomyces sp. NPDC048258 TaxID=3365527 RepID=UPI0037121434
MNPAEQTAAAVTADYPGLRQTQPFSVGSPLAAVTLGPDGTARFSWGGYEVHVAVGPSAHLNSDDVEDTVLHRQVRAHATLAVHGLHEATTRGHVEWDVASTVPEVLFPAAYAVAAADRDDPRFASAVLATAAKALDHARIATAQAGQSAAQAAEELQWERDRPEGVRRSAWLRQKRAEREAARSAE